MKHTSNKGFTLIELLIVITIIGILAVALLPRVVGAPQRARDVARKADLIQIATALEVYFSDNGTYPANPDSTCDIMTSLSTNYLGGKTIVDPLPSNTITDGQTTPVVCTEDYYYRSLSNNGVDDTGYLLLANTEIDATTEGYIDPASVDGDISSTALASAIATATATEIGNSNVFMIVR